MAEIKGTVYILFYTPLDIKGGVGYDPKMEGKARQLNAQTVLIVFPTNSHSLTLDFKVIE